MCQIIKELLKTLCDSWLKLRIKKRKRDIKGLRNWSPIFLGIITMLGLYFKSLYLLEILSKIIMHEIIYLRPVTKLSGDTDKTTLVMSW